jgi:hypothetical protein
MAGRWRCISFHSIQPQNLAFSQANVHELMMTWMQLAAGFETSIERLVLSTCRYLDILSMKHEEREEQPVIKLR